MIQPISERFKEMVGNPPEGINGCASVIVSIVTIVLAMGIGFSAVMGIGLAIYGLALICFMFIPN